MEVVVKIIIAVLFTLTNIFIVFSDSFLEEAETLKNDKMPQWYTGETLISKWGKENTERLVILYETAENKEATVYKIGVSMFIADRLLEDILEVYSYFEKYFAEYYSIILQKDVNPEEVTSIMVKKEFKDHRIKDRARDLIREFRLLYE